MAEHETEHHDAERGREKRGTFSDVDILGLGLKDDRHQSLTVSSPAWCDRYPVKSRDAVDEERHREIRRLRAAWPRSR